jgi:hypothetical protein
MTIKSAILSLFFALTLFAGFGAVTSSVAYADNIYAPVFRHLNTFSPESALVFQKDHEGSKE